MKKVFCVCILILFLFPALMCSHSAGTGGGEMNIIIVNNPYSGSRSGSELSKGPGMLEDIVPGNLFPCKQKIVPLI